MFWLAGTGNAAERCGCFQGEACVTLEVLPMPDFCTCGAQLPPDSLFCHKCGKPQRDILIPEVSPAEVSTPAAPPPAPAPADAAGPRLNFHDQVAVRIAVYVGVAATVLSLVLPLVNWLAAGFFAVYLYRRKTRRLLDVSAGVHMGWITGLVMFPLGAVIFAFNAISGRWGALWLEQMKNTPTQDPALQRQMVAFFQSGPGIAVALLFSLGFLFLLIIGLSIAGGALGAKVSRRQ
jgi:hypothetical protein